MSIGWRNRWRAFRSRRMSPLRRPSGSGASGQGQGRPASDLEAAWQSPPTPLEAARQLSEELTWKPNLILLHSGSASGKHGDPGETTAELAPAYGKQLRLDQVQHHGEEWSWWRHDALHWILHSLL
ncbi:uncharacterized protein C17orf80 homolog isoform X3 [Myotis daubentonii]|uniref:uncharacterized protein C17orf80 homolog isoform X3 n=1 Tax=Myotis daubentonii TaxID=98922 RepID=UPI002873B361|nr:uncharacterized protein C17orf80 homolog isoform X3 [Myotis daubentonii]